MTESEIEKKIQQEIDMVDNVTPECAILRIVCELEKLKKGFSSGEFVSRDSLRAQIKKLKLGFGLGDTDYEVGYDEALGKVLALLEAK